MEYINKLFNKDNLELLKELPDECIDLIYCDILYNTGKKFKDYDDNLGTPQEAINWYRPRLVEMKRVLKNSGLLYIQCDSNLSHYIKIELDNIFGIDNFRNEIIWWYNSAPRKKKDFGKDTILFLDIVKQMIIILMRIVLTLDKHTNQPHQEVMRKKNTMMNVAR